MKSVVHYNGGMVYSRVAYGWGMDRGVWMGARKVRIHYLLWQPEMKAEAEGILGAWMGNCVGTVERFTAAFGLKNALSSPFCCCLGLCFSSAFCSTSF